MAATEQKVSPSTASTLLSEGGDVVQRDNVDNFRLQLNEVEMLASIYARCGEFVMDEWCVALMADITEYVDSEGGSGAVPAACIQFALNLQLGHNKLPAEVCCTLPHGYPGCAQPQMYVRCPLLTRQQQHTLNSQLATRLARDEEPGQLRVGSLLQWLLEEAVATCPDAQSTTSPLSAAPPPPILSAESQGAATDAADRVALCRYWIYSHHIYNKTKRRTILQLGRQLQLTGFCLPGKPGIICAEGTSANCAEFWLRIKYMTWKKIVCKMKECEDEVEAVGGGGGPSRFRRFTTFDEVAFHHKGSAPGRDFHMDMAAFLKFLQLHGCGYVFKDYFGIDATPVASTAVDTTH